MPFLQISEALREAFNPLAWTVTMDGADPETALAVHVSESGTVSVRWPVSGTVMTVR